MEEGRGITVIEVFFFFFFLGVVKLTSELMKKRSNQQQAAKATKERNEKKRKDMSSMERVQLLQRKLYLKAKGDAGYKFYILYDKVFLGYVLKESWKRVSANGGTAGVDGVSIAEVRKRGVQNFLDDLQEDLRKQTYKPSGVKRVEIPKANGGTRPLGIPTVRDRVAQMGCKLVIEPLFEADFTNDSFGFRPKRSAQGAIKEIKEELKSGKVEVYDADLSKYFDTIPHDKLLIALQERISDKRILDLIRLWLRSPIQQSGEDEGGGIKQKVGTPQGGVISPLLSNIYLNLLDRIVSHPRSLFSQSGIRIIRYADDFVLMGKQINEQVKGKLEELLNRMDLSLNTEKSKAVNAEQNNFSFLGFTISYDRSQYGSKTNKYWNIRPSDKSQNKVRSNIKEKLQKIGHYPPEAVTGELNDILRGWLNYYDVKGLSYTRAAKLKLRYYLKDRLYRYYNRKSQRKSRLHRQQAFEKLVAKYGLIDPTKFYAKAKP